MYAAMPQPEEPSEELSEIILPDIESVYGDAEIIYVTTRARLDEMVDRFRETWTLARQNGAQPRLALDCEADGKDAMTATPLLLQVAVDATTAYVLPLNRPQLTSHFGTLWTALQDHQAQVIGHNLAYDYKLLRAHGLLEPSTLPSVVDTQLAELVLTTGFYDQKALWLKSVSLKRCVAKYLGLSLSKEVRDSFIGLASQGIDPAQWVPTDEQIAYGALDILVLFDLFAAQVKHLQKEHLMRSYGLRTRALMPVVEMELRGMLIDQDAWRAYLARVTQEREAVERDLVYILSPYEWRYRDQRFFETLTTLKRWETERDLILNETKKAWEGQKDSSSATRVGWGQYKNERMKAWRELHPRPPTPKEDYSPINLDSPKQKLRALNALGLELDSTDKLARAKALRGALDEDQRRVLETYQRFSELNQILKGFGENVLAMIDPATGKLHTHFNIHVTETGRWSSERPNFQNMPRSKEIRHAFLADPGFVVITADYSGQELAIVAALSNCGTMKRDITLGRDLYKEVAAQVWKIPTEQVTKDQRQKAKSALLGINYGLSAAGLERQHGIPGAEGEALLRTIKEKYPEVVAWGDKMSAQAFSEKYVQTPWGTKRYFKNPNMPRWQYDTQGRNAPVQGTAADIAYRLSHRLETNLVPQRILPVNFVHDEVVALAPEDQAEAATDKLIAEMQAAFNDILPYEKYGMKIRVDAHVANHWSKE